VRGYFLTHTVGVRTEVAAASDPARQLQRFPIIIIIVII